MNKKYTLSSYQRKWLTTIVVSDPLRNMWIRRPHQPVVKHILRTGQYNTEEQKILIAITTLYNENLLKWRKVMSTSDSTLAVSEIKRIYNKYKINVKP